MCAREREQNIFTHLYIEEYITESCSLINRVKNDQKLHRQLVESSYSHTLAVLKTQTAAINTALQILTGEYNSSVRLFSELYLKLLL